MVDGRVFHSGIVGTNIKFSNFNKYKTKKLGDSILPNDKYFDCNSSSGKCVTFFRL